MTELPIAVIGTGPAGLMAASRIAKSGSKVLLFEKRTAFGRKLLVAGSSGLNITYDAPPDQFSAYYGLTQAHFRKYLEDFSPSQWINFIHDLGIETFKGTSRRYFVEGMKASLLLKAWIAQLKEAKVDFRLGRECVAVSRVGEAISLSFSDGSSSKVQAAIFCLGGGSWEAKEKPLRWPLIFSTHGIEFVPFISSNAGFKVRWTDAFLTEAEGKPLKNVILHSAKGKRSGDVVVTQYGVEGTPVYFAGQVGVNYLDLKPDLTQSRVLAKLEASRENLTPLRRAQRYLNLGEVAQSLLFHMAPKGSLDSMVTFSQLLKRFPIEFIEPQPLDEAISSSGGINWNEVNNCLMLKKIPGVFVAGEMLDWDAPTGGFLIQGCVSSAHAAAGGALDYVSEQMKTVSKSDLLPAKSSAE